MTSQLFTHPSRRLQVVQTPIIPTVAAWIRETPGTISLGQGVVYYGPPPQATEALGRFLADPDNHKYKPVDGLPELRAALAVKLVQENGIAADEGRGLIVTAGGNMAFMNAVLAITDPGDEVVLLRPFYFNHEMALVMAGAVPAVVDTDALGQPDLAAIVAALGPRTRAVVTVSPNNPTGAVYPARTLRALNALCRERGLYHIHDEAYETFTYEGATHVSPGSFPESCAHTISLFSLSKVYGFASWRIGYMVVPEHLVGTIKKIQDTYLICPPVVSQYAALGALCAGSAYGRAHLDSIAAVRRQLVAGLATLGERCVVPPAQGAFYFLLRLRTRLNPVSLAERLVREHRVAVIPGTAFGVEHECTLRVSYGALEGSEAREGIARLVAGLEALT